MTNRLRFEGEPEDNEQALQDLFAVLGVLVQRHGGSITVPRSEMDALFGSEVKLAIDSDSERMILTLARQDREGH